jgi:peptidyl-tRNA hydrolase
MRLMQQLVEIHTVMKAARQAKEKNRYFEAAKELKNIEFLLDQCCDTELKEIFNALTSEKALLEEHLLYDMIEIWNSCLKWEEAEQREGMKKIILKVNRENIVQMEQVIQVLNYFEHLDFCLKKFGNKVLKYLVMPLITQKSTVKVCNKSYFAIIEVESNAASPKPHYTFVFTNVMYVFSFLYSHLNIVIEENVTVLNKLGEIISEEFCECLIKNCLADAIPNNSNDLKAYEVIAKETEDFQSDLVETGNITVCLTFNPS